MKDKPFKAPYIAHLGKMMTLRSMKWLLENRIDFSANGSCRAMSTSNDATVRGKGKKQKNQKSASNGKKRGLVSLACVHPWRSGANHQLTQGEPWVTRPSPRLTRAQGGEAHPPERDRQWVPSSAPPRGPGVLEPIKMALLPPPPSSSLPNSLPSFHRPPQGLPPLVLHTSDPHSRHR